ncbi:MAG TPA: hypothetical protein VME23_14475 [Terracidiphilus sp.]|nr:hypothetical protein [Terracidiphilus sp.]
MEKQNERLRESLLAHLPQPENLADYRRETEVLLAKHEKALFWEKFPSTMLALIAVGIFLVTLFPIGSSKLGTREVQFLWADACIFFFAGAIIDLRYRIYRSKVDTLKEVKQVQLQILELQAAIEKNVLRQ